MIFVVASIRKDSEFPLDLCSTTLCLNEAKYFVEAPDNRKDFSLPVRSFLLFAIQGLKGMNP